MSDDAENVCDPHELVIMVRKGDIEALDRMTKCHGQRLLEVGRRYCRNQDEAQDAVQDALLAAGEHLTDFRGDGSLEGWLVRMVANACHRMRRGQKNDPSLHRALDGLDTGEANPEALSARGEMLEGLGQALLSLKPEDRAIVLLAEAEEWTAPQIAEKTGLSPGAVRTRLSRARTKLRQELGNLMEATGET